MSELTIYYGDLEDVSKYSRKLANETEDYVDKLHEKVQKKLENLTGGSSGNTFEAEELISKKRRMLKDKKSSYNFFADRIDNFIEQVKDIDRDVAKAIEQNKEYFLDRNEHLKVSKFKEMLIMFTANDFFTDVKDFFNEDVQSWWRYGNGKIVLSAIGVVAGVVIFAFSFPVSGVLATLTVIGTAMYTIDSTVELYHRIKEKECLDNGEYLKARRYGKVTGVSEYLKTNYDNVFVTILADMWEVGKFVCLIGSIANMFKNTTVIKNLFHSENGLCTIMSESRETAVTVQYLDKGGELLKDGGEIIEATEKYSYTTKSIKEGISSLKNDTMVKSFRQTQSFTSNDMTIKTVLSQPKQGTGEIIVEKGLKSNLARGVKTDFNNMRTEMQSTKNVVKKWKMLVNNPEKVETWEKVAGTGKTVGTSIKTGSKFTKKYLYYKDDEATNPN